MMPNQPKAPAVAPCPVDWCPDAGHHEWHTHSSGEYHRFHTVRSRVEAGGFRTDVPRVTVTVAAEVYEDDETVGPDRSVQVILVDTIDGVVVLRSRDAVDEVVFALQDAADLAFGREPLEPVAGDDVDQDEFDAALAEVVERAGHPQDVNRLVAAAIRFRKAYLGAEVVVPPA